MEKKHFSIAKKICNFVYERKKYLPFWDCLSKQGGRTSCTCNCWNLSPFCDLKWTLWFKIYSSLLNNTKKLWQTKPPGQTGRKKRRQIVNKDQDIERSPWVAMSDGAIEICILILIQSKQSETWSETID